MIIILGLYLYAIVAILIIALIVRFITKNRWIISALVITAILIPTYDIIITNILGTYYCAQEPNPKTLIKKKVQYPLSIYWEDNVYPGFSKEDRELMITNYLDGVHLKTMALNGDDGKIYVYSKETPQESYDQLLSHLNQEEKQFDYLDKELKKHDLNKEPKHEWVAIRDARLEAMNKVYAIHNQLKQFVDNFPVDEQIYTKETMPKMNYTVTDDEVKLNSFVRKFLYSDETRVIENKTGEVIAYNRNYMPLVSNFSRNTFPRGTYYEFIMCGYEYVFNTMFNYQIVLSHGGIHHINGLNQKLYQRYVKGEK